MFGVPDNISSMSAEELCRKKVEILGGGEERVNRCIEELEDTSSVDGDVDVKIIVEEYKQTTVDLEDIDADSLEEAALIARLARAENNGEFLETAKENLDNEDPVFEVGSTKVSDGENTMWLEP